MTTGKLNGQVTPINIEARKRMVRELSLLIKKVNSIETERPRK